MQKGLSTTKLVEKASQEEANNSVIPDWVFQLGGATLVLGGLGYLWYRRRTLKVYNQLTDEEFFKLHFKIENSVFADRILLTRSLWTKILVNFRVKHLNKKVNFNSEKTIKEAQQEIQRKAKEAMTPLLKNRLKLSEHSNLTFNLFNRRKEVIRKKLKEKNQNGIGLTQSEKNYQNFSWVVSFLSQGLFVMAFQGLDLDLGEQSQGLDHKECLQCLLDYEADTIISYLNLYQTMVIRDRNRDLNRRIEAFVSIMEPRIRMVPLKSFAIQKLRAGGRYFELPEEERLDPRILFLRKALEPPQEAKYSRKDISDFFQILIFDKLAYIQIFMALVADPCPIKKLLPYLRGDLDKPQVLALFEESGLNFDPFKDFD